MDNRQYELEREKCLQLKARGLSRREIADRLGLTPRQVKTRLCRDGKERYQERDSGVPVGGSFEIPILPEKVSWLGRDMNIETGAITTTKLANGILGGNYFFVDNSKHKKEDDFFTPIDKDMSLFSYEETDAKRDSVKNYIESKYGGRNLKILVLNDLHIPFTDYKALNAAINKHEDADLVVVNGDMLDLFAVSKFAKDKQVALRREVEEGRAFIEYISKKFEDTVVTEGNHERRLARYIQDAIPEDMQFLFPKDILEMVVSGEIVKKKPVSNVHVVGSWWIKLFDTIYAHPDNYASGNLKTVQNTSEHFSLVENVWHRQCIIGHTHQAGWKISGEVKLMETGCICHDMDYHKGAKYAKNKWVKAHAVNFVDKGGNSDFNKSNIILL